MLLGLLISGFHHETLEVEAVNVAMVVGTLPETNIAHENPNVSL